jgi:NitT/TauT family transport system ATP-binding protein
MTAISAHNDAPSRTAAAVVPAIDLKGVTKTYPGRDGKATHALGPE